MKLYTVRDSSETAESIAQAMTGDSRRASDLLAANSGGKDYRGKDLFVVNKRRPDGTVQAIFCHKCMQAGTVLRLPAHWIVATGAVGAIGDGSVGVPVGGFCDATNWCDSGSTCSDSINGGTCVSDSGQAQTCSGDTDCSIEQYCGSDNTCHTGARGGQTEVGPTGSACTSSSQCGGTDICQSGKCTTVGSVVISTTHCSDVGVIKTVQQKLIDGGFAAGLFDSADGVWGCNSQKALDRSNQTFQLLLGGNCQGTVPSASGCGTAPPAQTCTTIGSTPTSALPCCAGLTSTGGGSCEIPATAKKSSWWWWILGGVAAAAGGVGIAYAMGDQKPSKKA
jgi:hypothetical protein